MVWAQPVPLPCDEHEDGGEGCENAEEQTKPSRDMRKNRAKMFEQREAPEGQEVARSRGQCCERLRIPEWAGQTPFSGGSNPLTVNLFPVDLSSRGVNPVVDFMHPSTKHGQHASSPNRFSVITDPRRRDAPPSGSAPGQHHAGPESGHQYLEQAQDPL